MSGAAMAAAGLCAALAIGPTAGASAPPLASGTVYGGATSKDAPFALILSPDRTRLSQALFYIEANCAGVDFPYFAKATFRPRRPAAVGRENVFFGRRLSRTGSFSYDGGASRMVGKSTLARAVEHIQGQVRGVRANGTFRLTFELVDKAKGTTRAKCSTSTLRWRAVSAPGRVYAGSSAQGGPVVVELDRARRKITTFRLGWTGRCSASGPYGLGEHLGDVKLAPAGSFADSLHEDVPLDGGGKRTLDISLRGAAGRTSASGTYRFKSTDRDRAGTSVDVCDSRALRWSARSSAPVRG